MAVPTEVTYIFYAVFIITQIVVGIYLLVRAIQTKRYHVMLLSFGMFSMVILIIIAELIPETPPIVRSFLAGNYPLFYLLFTYYAYHRGNKAVFKLQFIPLLVFSLVIRVFMFVHVNIFDYGAPYIAPAPLSPEMYPFYYPHVIFIATLIFIGYGWLGVSALQAYRNSAQRRIEPWIRFRNLMMCVSSFFFFAPAIGWFFMPTDGKAYGSIQGFWIGIVLLIFTNASGIINAIIWFMPRSLKEYVNKTQDWEEPKIQRVGLDPNGIDHRGASTMRGELLYISDYIGGLLASRINKPAPALKGLVLLTLQDELDVGPLYVINMKELATTIQHALRDRLEMLNIPDAALVCDELLEDLKRNQSLLTMMSI